MPELSSSAIAADKSRFEIWDSSVPFPLYDVMPDLDIVTHVTVEKAKPGGYRYLHEPSIAWHCGQLHAVWANHRELEVNETDELIRGRVSFDGGFSWQPPRIIASRSAGGSDAYNHPVISSVNGTLWGFFTRWDSGKPSTEIFTFEESACTWITTRVTIPTLVPFRPPMKMADGNWIISGEAHWHDAAIAISHGDDFTKWDLVVIPKPDGLKVAYPETTLVQRGNQLVAFCRPPQPSAALVSASDDFGRTWTPLSYSNFPISDGEPYCGLLSTGQQYVITNSVENERQLMSIAVTSPGGRLFERIWKVRHQNYPVRRFGGGGGDAGIGNVTEWSYPAAVEHEGNLYICYTHGKEDCCLSIIPISVLAAG
ncbi:MAG TPA: exo-alpha-sialidase [Capsulimonadaceae bacterium]|jgi:hypothetical protein